MVCGGLCVGVGVGGWVWVCGCVGGWVNGWPVFRKRGRESERADESEEDGDDMEDDVIEGTPMESRDVGTTFWEFTLTGAQQGMDDQARADVGKRDLTRPGPSRCLFVLAFVVVEVCGGEGGITSRCLKRQIVCGPIIEIKNGWDLLDPILFLWLLRLSLAGRIWFMMLEPPCTTFSLARHPSLRNADVPEGHDSLDFKTNEGN